MTKALALLLLSSATCAAQGVVTNAIGSASSLRNVLAPEMLATLQDSTVFNYLRAPLSHVLIRPAGSTQAIPATVTSGSTFLVPAGIPAGTAQLIWQYAGQPYESINVTLAPHNFELSRNGPGGSASVASVGLATPAKPGQTISLTGSGLGYGTSVSATIGGLAATVVYSGRGTAAGMDLIQLQIPAGVADGCYVPLFLNIGQSIVASAISVTASGAPCAHPLHLPLSDLRNLDSGGSLSVAEVDFSTSSNAALSSAFSRLEFAYADVYVAGPADVAQYFIPNPPATTGCTAPASFSVNAALVEINGSFLGSPLAPQPLDPGNSLTLSNSTNSIVEAGPGPYYTVVLPPPQDGTLASPPATMIPGGAWTLTTPGSSDLPASSFGFNLPAPVQLSLGAPVTMNRNSDQTIAWNGAGFDPGAVAQITLSTTSQYLTCTAPAQSGSLTIPATFLTNFAANSLGTLQITVTPGPAAISGAAFRTTGGASLAFVVQYTTSDARPVDLP